MLSHSIIEKHDDGNVTPPPQQCFLPHRSLHKEHNDESKSSSHSSSMENIELSVARRTSTSGGRKREPGDVTVVPSKGGGTHRRGCARRRSSPHNRLVAQLSGVKTHHGEPQSCAVMIPAARTKSVQSFSCPSLQSGFMSPASSSMRAFLTIPKQHQLKRHSLV